MEGYAVVGKRVPRIDGASKAAGDARFAGDVALPRMLHARVLRSPHPHARILRVDPTQAERLPGVKAVITGKELSAVLLSRLFSPIRDEPILAWDRVRYIGDEVAAVAAIDEEIAEEALELIQVEYEPVPAVFDMEEALREGAPQIHEHAERNLAYQVSMNFGNLEEGFQESHYIREDRFPAAYYTNCWLEADVCLAHFESPGKLTLWSPTQSPYLLQKEVAATVGVEEGKVRVISPHTGGGFGGRIGSQSHHHLAAFLSRKAGRPVRLRLNHEETFNLGNSLVIELRTGVKQDGTLLARHLRIMADSGGYASILGLDLFIAGLFITLPYQLSALKFEGLTVYTNNPVRGFLSGEGMLAANFAAGIQLDMIAEALGIDPIEICLRNAIQPGYTTINRFQIASCGLTESIRKVAENAHWKGNRGSLQGQRRGLGIGCGSVCSGAKGFFPHDTSAAMIKIYEDGTGTLFTGTTDMGQGSHTCLAQIAAEELGIHYEDILVVSGDTEITPFDLGAYGQRSTFIGGNAVKAAAREAKRKILEAAAERLQAKIEDLEARERRVFLKGDPARGISVSEAVRARQNSEKGEPIMGVGFYNPASEPTDPKTFQGNLALAYSFGAQVAEVEVDSETGQAKLKKMTVAHDVGFAINPLAVEGQIHGQVWSGREMALFQERLLEGGQTLNPSFLDYKFSTAMDAPEVEISLVETNDPYGPFGAKEVGRGPIMAVAQAIGNAIYDATGVRIKSLPITPEKILEAFEEGA